MAKIVAAYAVPHTPSFVADVAQIGASHEAAWFFKLIKDHLDQINADALVVCTENHIRVHRVTESPKLPG